MRACTATSHRLSGGQAPSMSLQRPDFRFLFWFLNCCSQQNLLVPFYLLATSPAPFTPSSPLPIPKGPDSAGLSNFWPCPRAHCVIHSPQLRVKDPNKGQVHSSWSQLCLKLSTKLKLLLTAPHFLVNVIHRLENTNIPQLMMGSIQ